MKLELTEHDIRLLKAAGSILIAFLMVRFLLMPGIQRFQENTIQRDMLEDAVEQMREAIDGIPMLEQGVEERKKELAELSAVYYGHMENHEVDELLTGLALEHGLFPVSLSIEEAVPMIPAPYLYGVTTGGAQGDSEYIQTGAGSMVLRGEEAAILGFLDDVEANYPAIRLCSLSVYDKMYFDEDWNIVGQSDMNCRLEIYMHDIIE